VASFATGAEAIRRASISKRRLPQRSHSDTRPTTAYLCLAEELTQPLVTADTRLVETVRASRSGRFADLVLPLGELAGTLAG